MEVGRFFFSLAPPAQNSPELNFHFIIFSIQSSLLESLIIGKKRTICCEIFFNEHTQPFLSSNLPQKNFHKKSSHFHPKILWHHLKILSQKTWTKKAFLWKIKSDKKIVSCVLCLGLFFLDSSWCLVFSQILVELYIFPHFAKIFWIIFRSQGFTNMFWPILNVFDN